MSDRPTRRRPFGVGVIIGIQVLSFVAAAAGLTAAVLALAGYIEVDAGSITLGDLLTMLLTVGLNLLSIYGLWRMRRWAWFITMLDLGVSMTVDLYSYFYGEPSYWSMLFNVLIVFYLNQRDVQNAFVRKRTEARPA